MKVIKPRRQLFDLQLNELWRYRHLVLMFIQRDLRAGYKQTILGPVWLIIPPLISSLVFTVIFGRIANLSADGSPHLLFYMAGIMFWGFFNACVVGNASTFTANASIFSKIYFPRLLVPLANMGATLISTSIQFALFFVFTIVFVIKGAISGPNLGMLLLPILLLQSAILALGVGSIMSSVTAKYRDLSFLTGFGMQLWMYATTVIYPLSSIPTRYREMALLNPMTPLIETFRNVTLGVGAIPWTGLIVSFLISIAVCLFGLLMFNRAEQTAMDTV